MSEFEKLKPSLLDAEVDLRVVEQEVYDVLDLFDESDRRDTHPKTGFEDVVLHEKKLTRAVIRNVFREYDASPIRKIQTLKDFCSDDTVALLTRTEIRGNVRTTLNTNIRGLCICVILKVAIRNLLAVEDLLENGTRERIRQEMETARMHTTEETWLSGFLRKELGWE